jgi:hypothetical protein
MKRLVLLTVILVPSAFHAIGNLSSAGRSPVTIGPRAGRVFAAEVTSAGSEAEAPSRVIRNLYPSATPEGAREDAWRALRDQLAAWLDPFGVPEGWSPPEELLRAMVREEPLESIDKDYGTIYVQRLSFAASTANRDRLIEAYERELAGRRLLGLASILAFVLTCLAAVTGYIRADEATRGYYTNTLRLTAVAVDGAAGAAVYYAMTRLS